MPELLTSNDLPQGCQLEDDGSTLTIRRIPNSQPVAGCAFLILAHMGGGLALAMIVEGLSWLPDTPHIHRRGGLHGQEALWSALIPGMFGAAFLYLYLWTRFGVEEWKLRRGKIRYERGWCFSRKRGSTLFPNGNLEIKVSHSSETGRSVMLMVAPANHLPHCLWLSRGEDRQLVRLGELVSQRTGWRLIVPKELRTPSTRRHSGRLSR